MPAFSLRRALTAVLVSTIVVLPLATSPALARIKKPGLDSLSQECFRVQTEADGLRAEYRNEATTNARREDILTELRKLGSYWIAAGCRDLFGDMSKFSKVTPNDIAPQPPKSLLDSRDSDSSSEPDDAPPTEIFLY
jgi:hypothetical protein